MQPTACPREHAWSGCSCVCPGGRSRAHKAGGGSGEGVRSVLAPLPAEGVVVAVKFLQGTS